MCEGIVEELRGIDLGDKRLNRRSQQVMEALAVISLDFSSTATCPNVMPLAVDQALTKCSMLCPAARSNVRLSDFPSMAM